MSSEQEIHITVNTNIVAKASPDMEQVKAKAVAGISEKELIERNVLGEFKEEDDEEQEQATKV